MQPEQMNYPKPTPNLDVSTFMYLANYQIRQQQPNPKTQGCHKCMALDH